VWYCSGVGVECVGGMDGWNENMGQCVTIFKPARKQFRTVALQRSEENSSQAEGEYLTVTECSWHSLQREQPAG
jgi:hypothetical protein